MPERDKHPRQQFRDAKRLSDVIVSSRLERGALNLVLIVGAHDNDWNLRPPPDCFDDLEAVGVRQTHVEKKQLRAAFNQHVESFGGRLSLDELVTRALEGDP